MPDFLHRRSFTIEWGHCDPAGIVFNSRFFEFFDWSTWIAAIIGAVVLLLIYRAFVSRDSRRTVF